jgi:hypothetical protein
VAVVINKPAATNTSDVNGFLRVEAHNLSAISDTGLLATTIRHWTTTFANACNLQGIGFFLTNSTYESDRSLQVYIQESLGTFTCTIASPTVITKAAHGLNDGDMVFLATTGALPTGSSLASPFYVRNKTADTFNISLTPTGSLTAFTGTQSGTHTLWAIRINETFTHTQISNASTKFLWSGIPKFNFTTPYAVTTAADGWRISLYQTGGTVGTWSIRTSNTTAPGFFAWGDNQLSLSSGDTLIAGNADYPVTIDGAITLNGVLGTGDTVQANACIITSNQSDQTLDNVALLKWAATPASSYTATFNGCIVFGSHSGMRVGTSAARIPFSEQANIVFGTPTAGTMQPAFRHYNASSTYTFGKASLFLYGEIPTTPVYVTLNGDAAISQNQITVTGDITGWAIGDEITVGKADVRGQGALAVYTINNISGQVITLSSNLLTDVRKSGGTVINFNRHGIKVSYTGSTYSISNLFYADGEQFSGVYFLTVTFGNSAVSNFNSVNPNRAAKFVSDCVCRSVTSSCYSLMQGLTVPPAGYTIERVYGHRMLPFYVPYSAFSSLYKSGRFVCNDTRCGNIYTGGLFSTTGSFNCKGEMKRNVVENSRASGVALMYISGINMVYEDNYFWGVANTVNQLSAICVDKAINATVTRNTIENCLSAYTFQNTLSINSIDTDTTFINNGTDVFTVAGGLHDYRFHSPTDVATFDWTYLPDQTLGTNIKFSDFNGTTNDDRGYLTYGYYQRCGDSLADTTAHTSGTGKFSLRLQPTDSTEQLTWSQTIPTGNIQNKDMAVEVWVKLNHTNYWAGTHQMPRLTITYDNGTTAYAQATQTTDWQRLFVPVTPTTTAGSVTATVSGMTDALTTDAYIYFDDYSIFYPVDITLDLGGLDDWANAEPVAPTIATLLSGKSIANAVWDDMTTDHTMAGSFGEKVGKKLLTLAKFLGLK